MSAALSIRDVESSLDPRVVESELRQQHAVTEQQLAVAIAKRLALAESGERAGLCEILVRDRFLGRHEAEAFIQRLTNAEINSAEAILADDVCQRYRVRPLQVVGGVLHLESASILRPAQLEAIRDATTVRIADIKVVPVSKLEEHARRRQLAVARLSLQEAFNRLKREEITSELLRMTIDALLNEALNQRASDIHIDCLPNPNSWLSFRVDGKLRQFMTIPERAMAALFTRLKTIAGMDASDRLRAQDGRIPHIQGAKRIDLRVASQPILGGETLTLRVLDPDSLPSVPQLFVGQPEMVQRFSEMTNFTGKNGGVILVSGPTGSGKTSTLYAALQRYERDRFNVITVEDPVEFTIPFARQIQINQILKQRAVDIESSILRHDPDIVVFGEIRNHDMARAVLKLAESGHLVLATIHANTGLQTFERLLSFFPPEDKPDAAYIVAHYLRTIINQRLIPRLCKCAEPIAPDSTERAAVGCPHCSQTGYFGRLVAHDSVLLPTDERRRAPIAKAILASSHLEDAFLHEGARHITRESVLDSLLSSGQIDRPTHTRILEG